MGEKIRGIGIERSWEMPVRVPLPPHGDEEGVFELLSTVTYLSSIAPDQTLSNRNVKLLLQDVETPHRFL